MEVTVHKTPPGFIGQTIQYEDCRGIEGFNIPFRWTVKSPCPLSGYCRSPVWYYRETSDCWWPSVWHHLNWHITKNGDSIPGSEGSLRNKQNTQYTQNAGSLRELSSMQVPVIIPSLFDTAIEYYDAR